MGQFFATEVAAGTYKGVTYAVPWFDNPEGLFYRTDLIKTPPTSPAQVVSDAQAAMKADKILKEGLAFEGAKYEGAITAFMTVDGAFGGHLTATSVNTPGNVAALKWLHDAIYVNKIAPAAVTGWQEGNVQQEFTAGHAAFAINYPFVASVDATTKGSPAMGHTGYIPFPAATGGRPGSALGGEMLAINAKTSNVAAVMEADPVPDQPVGRDRARGGDRRPAVAAVGLHQRAVREGAVLQAGQDAQRLRAAASGEPELPADLGRPAERVLVGVREHQPRRAPALSSAASQISSLPASG